jgi:hypothetical protein
MALLEVREETTYFVLKRGSINTGTVWPWDATVGNILIEYSEEYASDIAPYEHGWHIWHVVPLHCTAAGICFAL